MKLGEFLMKTIFFSGMSQKELADKINLSAPVLNDMVRGVDAALGQVAYDLIYERKTDEDYE